MSLRQEISWDQFMQVELRVGRIIAAEAFPEIGVRKSSAQVTALYAPADLVGKLVVGVVNFPKKQIGPFVSECLVTGFHDTDGNVALCVPDRDVPLGTRLL